MPVLVDDELAGLAGVPGGAGAGSITVIPADPRVLIADDIDSAGTWAWASAPLWADSIAIAAVYDATLSRVRLTGTGLEPFTLVRFDWSADQVRWSAVRGGQSVPVVNGVARLDDYEFLANGLNYYRLKTLAPFGQTSNVATITPTLVSPWLKSVARPFLNQEIEFGGDQLPIQRPARGGVFDIVGRSLPVAVTDVRGSRQYVVVLRTETAVEAEALDLLFASGDILFTHGSQCRVPSGVYWFVGTIEELEPAPEDTWRLTTAEVKEIAAPGPDVVGATSSWQTVINTYATWADVIAAKATWADLMELVGDPSEVIVP